MAVKVSVVSEPKAMGVVTALSVIELTSASLVTVKLAVPEVDVV